MAFRNLILTLFLLSTTSGISSAFMVYIDAEDVGDLQAPLEVREKKGAFGGKYVVAPQGIGNDGNGFARYAFEVPKNDTYYFWGRVIAADGGNDSFFWSIDDLNPISVENCDGETPGDQVHIWDTGNLLLDWAWSKLDSRNCDGGAGQDQLAVKLKKGIYTLNIIQREDGTELDGILVTDTKNPNFPKTERDAENLKDKNIIVPPPTRRVSAYIIYIDAEDAAKVNAPFEIKKDKDTAFGRKYIVVPQGAGNDGNGVVNFEIVIPKTGTYYFWGRVIAIDGGNDSFFWSIDNPKPQSGENCGGKMPGDQTHIWDTGQPIATWGWSKMDSRNCAGPDGQQQLAVDLRKGEYTLNIIQREDGTELDGILISAIQNPIFPETEADAERYKKGLSVTPKRKLSMLWGTLKTQQ